LKKDEICDMSGDERVQRSILVDPSASAANFWRRRAATGQ